MKIIVTKTEGEETINLLKNVLTGVVPKTFDINYEVGKLSNVNSTGISISIDAEGNYVMNTDERIMITACHVVNKHSLIIGSMINMVKSVIDVITNIASQLVNDLDTEIEDLFDTMEKEKRVSDESSKIYDKNDDTVGENTQFTDNGSVTLKEPLKPEHLHDASNSIEDK